MQRRRRGDGRRQRAALDYSVSYDYGAEINAFAKCYAVAAAERDRAGTPAARRRTARPVRPLYRRTISTCSSAGHHQGKNTIMSRQLAFVILAVVTMYRGHRRRRPTATSCGGCATRCSISRCASTMSPASRPRASRTAWEPPLGLCRRPQRVAAGADPGGPLPPRPALRGGDRPRARRAICIETTTVNLDRPVKIDTRGDQHRRRRTATGITRTPTGISMSG